MRSRSGGFDGLWSKVANTGMKSMSVAPLANIRVSQLIDANLDRAREGLRVIEDWCRYGLNQKDLVITLKDWRKQYQYNKLTLNKIKGKH